MFKRLYFEKYIGDRSQIFAGCRPHPRNAVSYANSILVAGTRWSVFADPVTYDQNLRQEAAECDAKDWAQLDTSLFAHCFTGQAKKWSHGAKSDILSTTVQTSALSSLQQTNIQSSALQLKRPASTLTNSMKIAALSLDVTMPINALSAMGITQLLHAPRNQSLLRTLRHMLSNPSPLQKHPAYQQMTSIYIVMRSQN